MASPLLTDQFQAVLGAAEAEADRDGTVSVDSALAEIDEIIAHSG
jgi:hypothetical protein